jgi:hypothetical protein
MARKARSRWGWGKKKATVPVNNPDGSVGSRNTIVGSTPMDMDEFGRSAEATTAIKEAVVGLGDSPDNQAEYFLHAATTKSSATLEENLGHQDFYLHHSRTDISEGFANSALTTIGSFHNDYLERTHPDIADQLKPEFQQLQNRLAVMGQAFTQPFDGENTETAIAQQASQIEAANAFDSYAFKQAALLGHKTSLSQVKDLELYASIEDEEGAMVNAMAAALTYDWTAQFLKEQFPHREQQVDAFYGDQHRFRGWMDDSSYAAAATEMEMALRLTHEKITTTSY